MTGVHVPSWKSLFLSFQKRCAEIVRSRRTSTVGSRSRKRNARTDNGEAVLELVKEGVRRFILNGAPISELKKVVLEASKKQIRYRHPLTGAVFRRIVKEAIEERNRRGR